MTRSIRSVGRIKARWQSGHAADCKSAYLGSTPGRASNFRPGGEIGRHKGFKIPRRTRCAGSSPAPGTITTSMDVNRRLFFCLKSTSYKLFLRSILSRYQYNSIDINLRVRVQIRVYFGSINLCTRYIAFIE